MKIRLALALVGLAISFAVPAFAQQKDTAASQIDEQIVKKFDEVFNNGDPAAVAALYTEDAVQVLRKDLFSVGRPSRSFSPGCFSKGISATISTRTIRVLLT